MDISRKNSLKGGVACDALDGFVLGIGSRTWYPPSPHPRERHDWRGFCKKRLQNPEGKRVRGQNLENARLKPLPAAFVLRSLLRDHDPLIYLWNARSDVTEGLWIRVRSGNNIFNCERVHHYGARCTLVPTVNIWLHDERHIDAHFCL